jgi:crossover junction endodeoxyribonuclease RusA
MSTLWSEIFESRLDFCRRKGRDRHIIHNTHPPLKLDLMGDRLFEMLIPRRPVSHQSKNRESLQAWKNFVGDRGKAAWNQATPYDLPGLQFSLVYFCSDFPADNIVKPIYDALVGIVFADDTLVADIDSHRRFIADGIDIAHLPPLLAKGAALGEECVYVRVSLAKGLGEYL